MISQPVTFWLDRSPKQIWLRRNVEAETAHEGRFLDDRSETHHSDIQIDRSNHETSSVSRDDLEPKAAAVARFAQGVKLAKTRTDGVVEEKKPEQKRKDVESNDTHRLSNASEAPRYGTYSGFLSDILKRPEGFIEFSRAKAGLDALGARGQSEFSGISRVSRGTANVVPPSQDDTDDRKENAMDRDGERIRGELTALLAAVSTLPQDENPAGILCEFEDAARAARRSLLQTTPPSKEGRAGKETAESSAIARPPYADCEEFKTFPASKKALGAKNAWEVIDLTCKKYGWPRPYMDEILVHKKLYDAIYKRQRGDNEKLLKTKKDRNDTRLSHIPIDIDSIAEAISHETKTREETKKLALLIAGRIARKIDKIHEQNTSLLP